ncbi:MAG: cyclase family protein [Planctomycetales bacterium]
MAAFSARRLLRVPFVWTVCVLGLAAGPGSAEEKPTGAGKYVDLSLIVAPDYPATWPAPNFHPFFLNRYLRIGPLSAYNSEVLAIDENTGTQLDSPAHSVPPPGAPYEWAGEMGKITGDKIPAWQLCGEACVIDCRALLDSIPKGQSPLVTAQHVKDWEAKHRPLKAGDVALFASGYSDLYYQPFPAGHRFLNDPMNGKAPLWPDPDPGCMEYLAQKGVMTAGTDSPSMGPLPGPMAAATHLAGLKYGMCWTESVTGLLKLPTTGAFYCMLGVKHLGGAGAETRAFAITEPGLASRLIESARKKQVVDLSVTLDEKLPTTSPGGESGAHRHPYLRKVLLTFEQTKGNGFAQTHFMDAHAGTHLVPPSYALPSANDPVPSYAPQIEDWLKRYEAKYGKRGTSDLTTEKIPLEQTCGRARVIDVSRLIGSTAKNTWPNSPEIKVSDLQAYEQQSGALSAGEVVIFKSGWSDRYYQEGEEGLACMTDPLAGKSEGWPAPGPEAIAYLAGKGIRCVGTDAPTLGGTNPRQALWTYWALGGKGMVGVEFLTNVGKLPANSYFLFAPIKIEGCHGGPGRAIALY